MAFGSIAFLLYFLLTFLLINFFMNAALQNGFIFMTSVLYLCYAGAPRSVCASGNKNQE